MAENLTISDIKAMADSARANNAKWSANPYVVILPPAVKAMPFSQRIDWIANNVEEGHKRQAAYSAMLGGRYGWGQNAS